MSRIDDAVERILRVKFVVGMVEKPFSDQSLLSTFISSLSLIHKLVILPSYNITCKCKQQDVDKIDVCLPNHSLSKKEREE